MPTPIIALSGYTVRRLVVADAGELQDLYERCSDYHQLHDGTPTRPTAGEEDLASRPPGKAVADKFAFGIYSGSGLIGYLDLVRDYPAEGKWWLGLLMLDPPARGTGLGSEIYRAAVEWVVSQGGRTIYLGVLERSLRARSFWGRQGFIEVRRQPYTSGTGYNAGPVIVMRHQLPGVSF